MSLFNKLFSSSKSSEQGGGFSIAKSEVISYSPEELHRFHLRIFEYIDNLTFMRPIEEFVHDSSLAAEYRRIAAKRFRDAGWAGDGEIQLLWLPPFVFPRNADTPSEGIVVWHVKQREDGISWLLSPIELAFDDPDERDA